MTGFESHSDAALIEAARNLATTLRAAVAPGATAWHEELGAIFLPLRESLEAECLRRGLTVEATLDL